MFDAQGSGLGEIHRELGVVGAVFLRKNLNMPRAMGVSRNESWFMRKKKSVNARYTSQSRHAKQGHILKER